MTTLKICLLGEFELYGGDEPLPPPATLKARSLLAYLVVHRDRACPREVLADLFWPDRPRDKALRSLSTALPMCRRCGSTRKAITGWMWRSSRNW
jgi:DNA-binding SARP family transcriptional activator